MKAVVKRTAGPGAELVQIPIPRPGPKYVLVKVEATSICGTDLHIYDWNDWAKANIRTIPHTLGHEFAGEVVEVGEGVTSIKVGDYISAETHIPCGHCYQCRTDKAHICEDMKILGVHVPGAFAEYVAIPEVDAWHNPRTLDAGIASVQEPLGNAVDTVLSEDVVGKTVLITGCGPIGMLAVGVARASGATTIIASDLNPYRLNIAKQMGADVVVNPVEQDLYKVVREATGMSGVDVTCEMSGAPRAIQQALDLTLRGGRVSLLGLPDKPVTINLSDDVIFKALRIYGITGRNMWKTWYKSSRLLASGRLDITPVVTHRMPMSEFAHGMDLMRSGNSGKIILIP